MTRTQLLEELDLLRQSTYRGSSINQKPLRDLIDILVQWVEETIEDDSNEQPDA